MCPFSYLSANQYYTRGYLAGAPVRPQYRKTQSFALLPKCSLPEKPTCLPQLGMGLPHACQAFLRTKLASVVADDPCAGSCQKLGAQLQAQGHVSK